MRKRGTSAVKRNRNLKNLNDINISQNVLNVACQRSVIQLCHREIPWRYPEEVSLLAFATRGGTGARDKKR